MNIVLLHASAGFSVPVLKDPSAVFKPQYSWPQAVCLSRAPRDFNQHSASSLQKQRALAFNAF